MFTEQEVEAKAAETVYETRKLCACACARTYRIRSYSTCYARPVHLQWRWRALVVIIASQVQAIISPQIGTNIWEVSSDPQAVNR